MSFEFPINSRYKLKDLGKIWTEMAISYEIIHENTTLKFYTSDILCDLIDWILESKIEYEVKK